MTVQTLADITGDNAKHQISTNGILARWVILGAVGGAVRFGDTNVSSSRGASIPSGATVLLPCLTADAWSGYNLSQMYAYVPNSATLTITYGGIG